MKKLISIYLLLIIATSCLAQKEKFTVDEERYYQTVVSLFQQFKNKQYDTTQRAAVFKQYVYFDNILADTSKNTILQRIKFFDEVFPRMLHYVDSVGMENLDAAPTRLFKADKNFFKPFESEELKDLLPFTLTYYDKNTPEKPIGVLLFEPKTHKLLAWILLNQGGYYYFLTFNMV
ncbi:hypothetical protein [Pedobacter sp.]